MNTSKEPGRTKSMAAYSPRFPFANKLLAFVAVVLGCLNLYFWMTAKPEVESNQLTEAAPIEKSSNAPAGDLKSSVAKIDPPFTWDAVETTHFNLYIANLRKLGFPEELIRPMVISEVNEIYAPQENPLKDKPVPHDADLSQRRRKPTVEDIDRLTKLRDIQVEKHKLLHDLLGVRIPREIIRPPNSRNYEGYEYALTLLPEEKQDTAQWLLENETLKGDWNQAHGWDHATEMEAYRRTHDEYKASIKQILTPDEFEKFELHTAPPGTELLRRTIGMDATEKENLIMWKATEEYWYETGGVHGRWRAERKSSAQIEAADEKLNDRLRVELGQDRFMDYQMAVDDMGQQLRNLAARYDLPRESLVEAYSHQKEADRITKSGNRANNLTSADRAAQLTGLEQKLQQTLGPEIFRVWKENRRRNYELHP